MNTNPLDDDRAGVATSDAPEPGSRWWTPLQSAGRLTVYVARRFWDDECFGTAASLSYTTLLAVVPLAAIGLAILAAFPVFDTIQKDLQDFIFQTFLPETVDAVKDRFMSFLKNTSGLTALGIVGLAVTALLLLDTVEAAFNRIWRAVKSRPLAVRFLIYWGLLTLGPLLIGGSMALSSYAFTMTRVLGEDITGSWIRILPFGLMWAGFAAAYTFVPNRPVRWIHALAGGLLAAVLFDLLKVGFAFYFTLFPTYQTIYGALSVLPLSLVWMYCAWCTILFGAQLAASLPEWRGGLLRSSADLLPPGQRLALALGILGHLREAHGAGGRVKDEALAESVRAEPEPIEPIVTALARDGFIVRTEERAWVLGRDLRGASLFDLCGTLGVAMTGAMDIGQGEEAWRGQLASAWMTATEANRKALSVSVEDLFAVPQPKVSGRAPATKIKRPG